MMVHLQSMEGVSKSELMAVEPCTERASLPLCRVERIWRATVAPKVQAEPRLSLSQLRRERGSPAASPSRCLSLVPSLSHADSETLRFLWLLIFCQFRDLRWPSK